MQIRLIAIMAMIGLAAYADNVLLVTDIHFNPYSKCIIKPGIKCQSLDNLVNSPIESWPLIFGQEPVNSYKEETNNAFLTQGIDKLVNIAKNDKVNTIFIAGDLLSHNFDLYYKGLISSKYNTPEYLAKFSFKTMKYVMQQFHAKLPNCKIYLVLGNNDSDKGDYNIASPMLLKLTADYLSKYLTNKDEFITSFSNGGYFSTSLNNQVILIGINTNILASNDTQDVKLAIKQLNWLQQTLAKANSLGEKVIMLQHMPYGVDLYKTAATNSTTSLLDPLLQDEYLNLLNQYASIITTIYASHFHAEYLSLVNSITPVIGTIAFNSGFGNNPGFKIINIASNGNFNGYVTYYSTLANKTLDWKPLYDYSQVYGQPAYILSTLNKFPFNLKNFKVINYRKFFNGNNLQYPQPISDDSKWKYYYCGLNHLQESEYNNCLESTSQGYY